MLSQKIRIEKYFLAKWRILDLTYTNIATLVLLYLWYWTMVHCVVTRQCPSKTSQSLYCFANTLLSFAFRYSEQTWFIQYYLDSQGFMLSFLSSTTCPSFIKYTETFSAELFFALKNVKPNVWLSSFLLFFLEMSWIFFLLINNLFVPKHGINLS